MRFLNLTVVVILGLIAYRLAMVMAVDKVAEPFRKWLYRVGAKRKLGGWAFSLVSCPYCISVWIAALAVVWWVWLILPTWPGIGEFLVAIPAVAGVARILVAVDMTAKKYQDG